ncbi:MAG: dTDP-4-dehydrorhamnose 3,5-epimerase [Thermoanaerobaculia bacterium]
MIVRRTAIPDTCLIELERIEDHRGFFARTFCSSELRARGLTAEIAQTSISYNHRKGTLRGMHCQVAPHEEVKYVRCTGGRIFDVALDLRSDSPTFLKYFSVELSAENRKILYVPKGVAHGFLTLEDECEVLYQMQVPFHSESSRGVRWNDPRFGIVWPSDPVVISERDQNFPDFEL